MTATALIPHSSLLTGSDSGWGVGVGRESEVDDSAHFLLTINNLTRLKLSRRAKSRGLEGCQLTGVGSEPGVGGTPRCGFGRASLQISVVLVEVLVICCVDQGVWWNAKVRILPSHPPAASLVSGLLDSVLTPGSGRGGGESGYSLVTSADSVMAIAEHAVARHKVMCLNLGAPYVCRLFTDRVDKLLPYMDLVIGAGDEALAFAEAHQLKDRSLGAVAKFFAAYGWVGRPRHRLVIITQGPDPILLVSSEDMLIRTIPVDPIPPENTIDTNGAGDAFAAGFLSEFIACGSIDDAVEAGKKAAAYIIGKSGFSLGPRTEY
nr:unnamed protein product [Spirometra erinaceieuropaei]